MRLSDAIRKGCEGTHQAFGTLFTNNGNCALGAAMRGLGMSGDNYSTDQVIQFLAIKYKEVRSLVSCPSCGEHTMIGYCVIHLNDHHKMSREAIAEWVETIENNARIVEEKTAPVEEPVLVGAI